MLPARNITRLALLFCALALVVMASDAALAQARNPFNVGISEGGGQASGLVGWILAKQSEFERMMSAAVRAIRAGDGGLWALLSIAFAYGVFHAAGPGHGKAVVAAYMFANEQALKRGIIISFAAALLQGVVAITIVGALALLLNATARQMRDAASMVEVASFAGLALFGAWLAWRKARALWQLLRPQPQVYSRFLCEACEADEAHEHGPNCGHFHMPDPALLGKHFSWRDAALTVVTAGSRPCSGAILILVFAMAQGIFWAGVWATLAMALGTAITTGALAAVAVLAKGVALRMTGETSRKGMIAMRALECAAALAVFLLGAGLLLGVTGAGF